MNFALSTYLCREGGERGLHKIYPHEDESLEVSHQEVQPQNQNNKTVSKCVLCDKSFSKQMDLMIKILYTPRASGPSIDVNLINNYVELFEELLNYNKINKKSLTNIEKVLIVKILYSPSPADIDLPQKYPTEFIDKRYKLIHSIRNEQFIF